ncbi:hypothetical protein F2P56_008876 [Juglans regia]|uniref:Germin-like protein n=2 Tax=Juglans regia TaxID=51240 RepID=A0A2I4HVP3_JUGRE|nr:putative germin-like protein 2-1 [Juglans regia]KAF5472136.1 hypothetical protein F2P56_008876 [Juglans regia]
MASRIFLLGLLAVSFTVSTLASDPSPLHDFCVADKTSSVQVNGLACKDPKLVQADDFFFSGLHIAANTTNVPFGARLTPVTVAQVGGLNTLGISISRVDYAPGGFNPPHTHPRATEIITVLEGNVEVGFVTSYPDNRLMRKVLGKGDVFVFPIGLVHYQVNVGSTNAAVIVALNSQNPGIVSIPNVLFGSTPKIGSDILARAFQVDRNVVDGIKSKF